MNATKSRNVNLSESMALRLKSSKYHLMERLKDTHFFGLLHLSGLNGSPTKDYNIKNKDASDFGSCCCLEPLEQIEIKNQDQSKGGIGNIYNGK